MKNMQKGSANAFLVILVLVLAAAVVYLAVLRKTPLLPSVSPTQSSDTQTSVVDTSINSGTLSTTPSDIKVAGMQQYTDKDFGFSFWYPTGLKVTKSGKSVFTNANIKDATVVANVSVGDIAIEEVHSTTRTMTDNIANFGKVTYTYDVTQHAWMVSSENDTVQPATTKALAKADISENTMGGLHMFPGVFPYNTVIIPLSADNFLVIDDEGGDDKTAFFARTITALDPSVATPVSLDTQTKTVQAAANIFTSVGANTGMRTFVDPLDGFSFQYPTSVNNGHVSLDVPPSVFVTQNKTNIDANGCYMMYGPTTSKGVKKTLGDISYCVTQASDPGAGQLGNWYGYTTYHNGSYITLQYQTMQPNGCGAYDSGPAQQSCQADLNSIPTTVIAPIEQSVGTLKFQ